MQCPECGEAIEPDWDECPACETPLGSFCPECGREVKGTWKKCPSCKTRLRGTDTNRGPTPPTDTANRHAEEAAAGPTSGIVGGDVGMLKGDISVDQSRKEEHVHYHGKAPDQREVVTATGIHCPICGALAKDQHFQCNRCGLKYLCMKHQDENTFLCRPCVEEVKAEQRLRSGVVEEGMTIGERYRIERLLGEGGMGRVFLATDLVMERPFALKFLPPELSRDESALHDLRREMDVAMELTHENIVRLYNLENQDGHKFLKMEYVDGPTLASMLLQKRKRDEVFSLEELLPILKQVCDALDYIHGKKVIHRDLKPANVMLTTEGTVKITDLGIARVVKDTMSRVSNRPTTGTLVYMSPEQCRGERDLDGRSDLYSLGCMVYELLSGEPPFFSGDIFSQHLHVEPKPIECEQPWLSEALMKALAKDREQRPVDAGMLYEGLTGEAWRQKEQEEARRREEDEGALRVAETDFGKAQEAHHSASGSESYLEKVCGERLSLWRRAAELACPEGEWLLASTTSQ